MKKEQEKEFDRVWNESQFSSNSEIALKGKDVKAFVNKIIVEVRHQEREESRKFIGDQKRVWYLLGYNDAKEGKEKTK